MPVKVRSTPRKKKYGIVRGILADICEDGEPRVDFALNSTGSPVVASSTIPVKRTDVGRDAVLMFEDGDLDRPVLLGLVESPDKRNRVEIDCEQLVLTAEREVVLHCGEASITLTRAGKVIIRGTYVVSRSSGANRIKGASVQIN